MGQQLSPLFARQPIFNQNLEVVAYELLFRSSAAMDMADCDDQSSLQVISYAFGDKVGDVLGPHKAFINFTRNLLLTLPLLPPDKLVVEVLENIDADNEVIRGLKQLKKAGYKIALDDFFLTKDNQILLDFADIVKIDVLALSEQDVKSHVDLLQARGIEMLAEKVETYEMLERCKRQGFNYFQGYFLSRPQVIQGINVTDTKNIVLQKLAILTNPMAKFDDVVHCIDSDPQLSQKVLDLINSPAVALGRHVNSLSLAIAMTGLSQIRNWAVFVLLCGIANKPDELHTLCLTRARCCELLAARVYNRASSEIAFTAGLLSTLDAFLDMTIEQLASQLNFADQVEMALLHQTGKIGKVLQLNLLHEQGRWNDKHWETLSDLGLTEEEFTGIYTSAVSWSESILDG